MVSGVAACALAGAVTAAQENLDNLVDKQQGNGNDDTDQPLVIVQRGQAQDSLQEAKLSRQDCHQQRQSKRYSWFQSCKMSRLKAVAVSLRTLRPITMLRREKATKPMVAAVTAPAVS